MDSVYLLIVCRSLVIVGGHFFSLNIFTGVFSDYISISIFLLELYNYIIQNNSILLYGNWCNVPLKKRHPNLQKQASKKDRGRRKREIAVETPDTCYRLRSFPKILYNCHDLNCQMLCFVLQVVEPWTVAHRSLPMCYILFCPSKFFTLPILLAKKNHRQISSSLNK